MGPSRKKYRKIGLMSMPCHSGTTLTAGLRVHRLVTKHKCQGTKWKAKQCQFSLCPWGRSHD